MNKAAAFFCLSFSSFLCIFACSWSSCLLLISPLPFRPPFFFFSSSSLCPISIMTPVFLLLFFSSLILTLPLFFCRPPPQPAPQSCWWVPAALGAASTRTRTMPASSPLPRCRCWAWWRTGAPSRGSTATTRATRAWPRGLQGRDEEKRCLGWSPKRRTWWAPERKCLP